MNNKFIYTDDPSLIDKLIKSGYQLIKTNDKMHIFENKPTVNFDIGENHKCAFSNTLIF
jgi:hypothetical protein